MGYRDAWLNAAGALGRHTEGALYARDMELRPAASVCVLEVGVENGGGLQALQSCLPEGSTVIGVDWDARCADLPDVTVLIGDATDSTWLRKALRGMWFDYIIDDSRTGGLPHLWPFLKPDGVLMVEGYEDWMATSLIAAVQTGQESWLPAEELLRVTAYPGLLAVQKRHARVLPYMELMSGNFSDVRDERDLLRAGVKRVIL